MLYQLPNGKVINLTIDEYLNLTDEDIQALTALNFGEYPSSYWYGSALDNNERPQKINEDFYILSLEQEDEYCIDITIISIQDIPDEDDNLLEFLDLD